MSIFRSLVDDVRGTLGGASEGLNDGFRAVIDGFANASNLPRIGGGNAPPPRIAGSWGAAAPPRIGGFGPPIVGGAFAPALPQRAKPPVPTTPTGAGGGGGAANAAGLGSSQWADLINEEAAKYGDAPELAEVAQAVAELESGGKADAQGVVVTQGAYAGQRAQGLMQIMPGNYPGVNLLDPRTNVQKGLEMLYARYKRYGNWDSAVAAYFGAIDANGRPTSATDDNGTSGLDYIAIVNKHRQAIRAARGAGRGGGTYTTQTGIKNLDTAIATLQGTPYTHGGIRNSGNPRDGMDCSSFAGWALGMDRNLWNAQTQYDNTTRVGFEQMQVGDLVFFQGTTNNDPSARPVTHVGVYLGGGKMIHTGGSPGLTVVDLNTDYWRSHYYGSGRVRR
jgi:cell wall-associated NlpC family hydrolase